MKYESDLKHTTGGLIFGARLLRFSRVWISTFKFLLRGKAEESNSDDEVDPVEFSDAPSFVPFPGDLEIEALTEVGSPTSVAGTLPSDLHGLEVLVIEAAQSPTSDI